MFIPHYVSCVMCHVSHVMCHMSTYFFTLFFYKEKIIFSKNCIKWWSWLVEGVLSTGHTPSRFCLCETWNMRLSKSARNTVFQWCRLLVLVFYFSSRTKGMRFSECALCFRSHIWSILDDPIQNISENIMQFFFLNTLSIFKVMLRNANLTKFDMLIL